MSVDGNAQVGEIAGIQNLATPTLNNLLTSKPMDEGSDVNSTDRYAATAAAVAAGAGGNLQKNNTPDGGDCKLQSPANSSSKEGVPQQQPPQHVHPQQQQPPQGPPQPMPPHGYPQQPFPPQFMHSRPQMPMYPGYNHYPHGMPGYPGYPQQHPQAMVRPGMPPGAQMPGAPMSGAPMPPHMAQQPPPGPSGAPPEWANGSKSHEAPGHNDTPTSSQQEPLEGKPHHVSPNWPAHAQRAPMPPQGMMPMPPMMPMNAPPSARKDGIVDKLVGPPNAANPPRVMPERRAFFERLVGFCEQHGEAITQVPQVSKQTIDLHRLYIAVRNRGGFEAVTRDKVWKSICPEANPELSESSAAGYQLRKHYQKHLLLLECLETGRNAEDAVAFADKLKRQRPPKKEAATPTSSNSSGATPSQTLESSNGSAGGQMQFAGASGSNLPTPQGGFPPHHDGNYYYQGGPPGPPTGAMFPPGGYPPGAFGPRVGNATPMRALGPMQQQDATSSEDQRYAHAGQPATPQHSSTQPPTPAMLQADACGSQAGSRAPSAGPVANVPTPDSCSRMSATTVDAEQRPTSTRAPSTVPTASTPNNLPNQTPNNPAQSNFYGQPAPMYSGHRGTGYPGPAGYPPGGNFHPGSQQYPMPLNHPSHPSHPSHPHHQQFLQQQQQQQQQMWHQQRGYPPAQGVNAQHSSMPNAPRFPYQPPRMAPPASQPVAPSAPSPGSQKQRFGTQGTPAYAASPARPSVTNSNVQTTSHASGVVASVSAPTNFTSQPQFAAGSVEATTISQKRRRKVLARDLMSANPRRLVMALRSGLEAEAVWAINALNVQLYDDTHAHPSLAPGLLNVIVEHLWATLSLLYPKYFKVDRDIEVSSSTESSLSTVCNGHEVQEMKAIVVNRSAITKKSDYTKISRTGRKVQYKEAAMPHELMKMMSGLASPNIKESIAKTDDDEDQLIVGGALAERVAQKLADEWKAHKVRQTAVFSKYSSERKEAIHKEAEEDEAEMCKRPLLKWRSATESELSDSLNEVQLETHRPTAFTIRDEFLFHLTQRALALANILRGFSFVAGNEATLCKNKTLLYIIGRCLMLLVREVPLTRISQPSVDLNDVVKAETAEAWHEKAFALVDSDDSNATLLMDTAAWLRDDAFVMFCYMSGSLDLHDIASEYAYPLLEGLLFWCTASVAEAVDPIVPAHVSARNYSLEILCKMSVVESNMDLFLATGNWYQHEKLVHILAKLLSMSEESNNREFAIVILNALCNASEAVRYVAAIESPAVHNLIAFIDNSDHNMHQVMQSHGMSALRDNPELMGTSVGMLRRAAAMLKLLCKVPEAARVFARHEHRLLQHTMSQLMDSRVAATIADTLFEIQSGILQPQTSKAAISSNEQINNVVVKTEVDGESELKSENCDKSPEQRLQKELNVKRPSPIERDEVPESKKICLENGFDKVNGKLEKGAIKLQEALSENGSMTIVA